MRRISFIPLVTICLALVACATPLVTVPTTVPLPAPLPTTSAKSGTLRFALNGSPGVKDIPSLMALDALQAQGYTTQVITFAKSDQMTDALARGDVEIASPSANTAWTAIAKGADFRTIVGRSNMSFYLIVSPDIQSCQDLNGKTLSFANRQSVGYLIYDKYMKENCPGINPNIILVAESKNRVVSLDTHQVDGSYLDIDDWLPLNQKEPGKFHVLIDYQKAYPQIQYSTFSVYNPWAKQHPEIVKDFVRAVLTANRQVMDDPQTLINEIVKRLSLNEADAKELARAFLNLGLWDANGALTNDNLRYTMDFMVQNGAVPQGKSVQDVTDLSYLNAVLNEIGRQPPK
ncbi:MAG TPA: ABC transporter substrate-binding protein [Anaerolineae bacterium]|nr:ABC transporter substrate-binding protein [Anaerolineae bacterium]